MRCIYITTDPRIVVSVAKRITCNSRMGPGVDLASASWVSCRRCWMVGPKFSWSPRCMSRRTESESHDTIDLYPFNRFRLKSRGHSSMTNKRSSLFVRSTLWEGYHRTCSRGGNVQGSPTSSTFRLHTKVSVGLCMAMERLVDGELPFRSVGWTDTSEVLSMCLRIAPKSHRIHAQ